MFSKLFKNSVIYGIAPSIPKIVGLLMLPLLTPYLTDVDYGIAGTIMAYTTALAAFSTLGLNVCLQVSFFRSRGHYKYLWRQIYGFLQIWMILFAILQGTVLYFIIPAEAIDNRWLIIILTNFNGVLFGPAGFLGSFYYQYEQKPMPIAVRSLVAGFLTIIINYILIVNFRWGYMGWYVSSFAATFIINITYWYDLTRKIGITPIYNFKIRTIKEQLKVSLPTIPHYYSVFLINTSNRLVMDWSNIGVAKIGEYNMAHQISTYIETGVQAIERAALPMCMTAINRKNAREEKSIVYTYVIVTFLLTFLLSLWSKQIFSVMIKNEVLAATYPYAIFLIMGLNYRPVYFAVSNIYFYNEKTKDILLITFMAGVLALVLNLIFIPKFGLWAAVFIAYFAYLYQGYAGFFMPTFKKYTLNKYPYIFLMITQLALTMICYLLREHSIGFKSIISAVSIAVSGLLLYSVLRLKNKKQNEKDC